MKAVVDEANQFDELVSFIAAFARAEQRYGGYSYETELSLSRIIRKLGLNSEILATPTSLEIAFWKDDANKQTIRLVVTRESGYDLNKIAQNHDVVEKVTDGQISVKQGLELLNKIDRAPPIYGKPLKALAFVLAGLGFAVIVGGSWLDVLFAGLLSLISFGVILLASRAARVTIIMELLAAAIAGFLATAIAVLLPGLDPVAMTVCAVVWFIPGFGLTTAPREIIYGNTISGLVYLTNAVVVALKIFAGAIMGVAFAEILLQVPSQELLPSVDPVWAWVSVPMLVVGLALLFKVSPKYLVVILLGSWLVWAGVQTGNIFGYWQGTFLGAIALAIFAKLSTRRLRLPSATVALPLIMILVPGYGFLSALYVMRSVGLAEGLTALIQVVIIIVAIIAGVFVGDSIVSTDFSKFIRITPPISSKLKRGKQSGSEKTA